MAELTLKNRRPWICELESQPDTERMENAGMPTCHVHRCELIAAVVPIRYGYPLMDESWDLEQENPYHGLYDLGGCVVTLDAPKTRRSWVCPVCKQNVNARRTSTNDTV